MIYFITYPDSESHWQGMYNDAVISEFSLRQIPCRKFVVDFFAQDCHRVLEEIQMIRSTSQDIWLLAWAQNPIIELIEHKPGRKFGHVHGLGCFVFEPAVLLGVDLNEHVRFGFYERIFVNSEWSYASAVEAYPEHARRFAVAGFPMDYARYKPYENTPKDEHLVVFNQRFALERAPTLVVEIARRLVLKGYRVQQLSGEPLDRIETRTPDLGRLLRAAMRAGLEFVWNRTKDEYQQRLAAAGTVVTTSLCDNLPVALLEAIHLGIVPVAPRAMCFPEFVHPGNLYAPFCLDEITGLVDARPKNTHHIEQYSKAIVIGKYVDAFRL